MIMEQMARLARFIPRHNLKRRLFSPAYSLSVWALENPYSYRLAVMSCCKAGIRLFFSNRSSGTVPNGPPRGTIPRTNRLKKGHDSVVRIFTATFAWPTIWKHTEERYVMGYHRMTTTVNFCESLVKSAISLFSLRYPFGSYMQNKA